MNKTRLLLVCVLFSLPALACSLFQTQDLNATATFVAGEIFATMTAEAPTVTPTPTITVTPTPTDTPTPTETPLPTFGHITFARGGSEDNQPIDPSTKFPTGIPIVYACWDFWGMDPDMRVTQYWYRNEVEQFVDHSLWDRGASGSTCFYVDYEEQGTYLAAGNWVLKLYVGTELAQIGTFRIVD